MTYLKKIAEQVIRRLEAGDQSSDSNIDDREVYLHIQQALNKMLKLEFAQTHVAMGEMIPPHAAIATYTAGITSDQEVSGQFVCEKFDARGLSNNWIVPSSDTWDTDDPEPWALTIYNSDITVSVSGGVYSVSVSTFILPDGKTGPDLASFIETANNTAIIELVGVEPGTAPNVYAASAMSNVVISEDGSGNFTLSFDYDLESGKSALSGELSDRANDSHNLLASVVVQASYTVPMSNFRRCYYDVSVGSSLGKLTLPAQPMNMPRGMGIWRVYDPRNPSMPFIPIPQGHYYYVDVKHNGMGSIMGGVTCFEIFDRDTLLFNKPASELPGTVNIQLLVVDPSQIGEYDPLPVPPEMEDDIIRMTLELMAPVSRPDKVVDDNPES